MNGELMLIVKVLKKIGFEDIAKLHRDVLLHHATQAILVYPKIIFKERDFTLSIDNFKFKIEEKAMPC